MPPPDVHFWSWLSPIRRLLERLRAVTDGRDVLSWWILTPWLAFSSRFPSYQVMHAAAAGSLREKFDEIGDSPPRQAMHPLTAHGCAPQHAAFVRRMPHHQPPPISPFHHPFAPATHQTRTATASCRRWRSSRRCGGALGCARTTRTGRWIGWSTGCLLILTPMETGAST